MEKKEIIRIIEWASVFVVTLAMLIYGLAKYVQFDNPTLVSKTVSEMTGMELMWSFYGYSKTYAILLGIAEVTGGILFFFVRTRVLGGVLLTGILLNVIIQDVIYGVNQGALIAAIIYQLLTFLVLWINKDRLMAGIQAMIIRRTDLEIAPKRRLLIILSAILLAVIIKIIEFKLTH